MVLGTRGGCDCHIIVAGYVTLQAHARAKEGGPRETAWRGCQSTANNELVELALPRESSRETQRELTGVPDSSTDTCV